MSASASNIEYLVTEEEGGRLQAILTRQNIQPEIGVVGITLLGGYCKISNSA